MHQIKSHNSLTRKYFSLQLFYTTFLWLSLILWVYKKSTRKWRFLKCLNYHPLTGTESSCLPPWLETKIPAAPYSKARRASSGTIIPLRRMGSWVLAFSHSIMPLKVRSGSVRLIISFKDLCSLPICSRKLPALKIADFN